MKYTDTYIVTLQGDEEGMMAARTILFTFQASCPDIALRKVVKFLCQRYKIPEPEFLIAQNEDDNVLRDTTGALHKFLGEVIPVQVNIYTIPETIEPYEIVDMRITLEEPSSIPSNN